MQIAVHIGANCTDDERLLKSCLKNADALKPQGTWIPSPGRYRTRLREAIQSGAWDARPELLSGMNAPDATQRLVLSNSQFMCVVKRIFEKRQFYHLADEKIEGMRRIFPEDDIHYFLALRNPASFIPATFAEQSDFEFKKFMRGLDPTTVTWSSVVDRIRARDPKAQLTVWCDEDTPMIWAKLVRGLLGVDDGTRIAGGFDLVQALLTEDGMAAMVAEMRQSPPRSEADKQAVIARYLEAHGRPDRIEQEITVDEWSLPLIETLTKLYDQDVARIAARPDITFVTP